MPTFELTTPDGKVFEIDAADATMAQKALDYHFGGGKSAPPPEPVSAAPQVDAVDTRAAYEAMPWYKQAGTAVQDISRLAANSAMFGYGDKLAALARGTSLNEERALTQQSRDRAGFAGDVAEIGGVLTSVPR